MNIKVICRPSYKPAQRDGRGMSSLSVVPEVIGAPTPSGVVIVQANNCPTDVINSSGNVDSVVVDGNRKNKDAWFIPAHTPVFGSKHNGSPVDRDGVVNVTAFAGEYAGYAGVPQVPTSLKSGDKILGVSVDGLYDVEQQKAHMRSSGANRFSMAVAGLVTVASHPDDNNKFAYGDRVYVDAGAKVERLHDTSFVGLLRYTPRKTDLSLGTFVNPVGPEGGMRVLLNFYL